MNKVNDYTSLSVSSKGRVLLHIHRSKLFIFFLQGLMTLQLCIFMQFPLGGWSFEKSPNSGVASVIFRL